MEALSYSKINEENKCDSFNESFPSSGGILILRRQPRGEGGQKMPIILSKISTKGGRGVKKVQNLVYVE